jgi:hypothetical protein
MNRNYILGVLVAVVTLGCATTQNPSTADASKSVADAATAHCLRDTGSFIKRPEQQCANRSGASYSQQEIQDTGQFSTADALRELDARVQ